MLVPLPLSIRLSTASDSRELKLYAYAVTDLCTNTSRAKQPASLEQHESQSSSLIDVDSPHVSSAPSDFESQEVQTRTQAERMEHEAEDKARDLSEKASDAAGDAKKKAATKGKEGKAKAKKSGAELKANSDNPVVIGNAVAIAVISATLGFGAYQKHQQGALTWKVAGIWGGAVGAFAVGDYFLSQ